MHRDTVGGNPLRLASHLVVTAPVASVREEDADASEDHRRRACAVAAVWEWIPTCDCARSEPILRRCPALFAHTGRSLSTRPPLAEDGQYRRCSRGAIATTRDALDAGQPECVLVHRRPCSVLTVVDMCTIMYALYVGSYVICMYRRPVGHGPFADTAARARTHASPGPRVEWLEDQPGGQGRGRRTDRVPAGILQGRRPSSCKVGSGTSMPSHISLCLARRGHIL